MLHAGTCKRRIYAGGNMCKNETPMTMYSNSNMQNPMQHDSRVTAIARLDRRQHHFSRSLQQIRHARAGVCPPITERCLTLLTTLYSVPILINHARAMGKLLRGTPLRKLKHLQRCYQARRSHGVTGHHSTTDTHILHSAQESHRAGGQGAKPPPCHLCQG